MIRTYSDNAIMAKVRALYGKRLNENDYAQLAQKKSVGEVAGYLKKETYYSEILQEVKEDLIHREQLEHFVHRRVLDTYQRLLKYAHRDNLFMTMYVMNNEIQQLLTAIRLLNSGSINRYIITLPVYLSKLMSFDLFAIAGIHSFDDLLGIVEQSDYYRIIGKFRPTTAGKPIDITACEAALLTHYYEKSFATARKMYSGDTLADLEKILVHQVTVHNISIIYRMRRYLNSTPVMIRPRLIIVSGVTTNKLYEQLLNAPDNHAMMNILNNLRSTRSDQFDWNHSSEKNVCHLLRIRKKVNQRVFRFSVQPVAVVISYMTLLDIEVNNLVNIIEGIRYEIPPAEIQALLAM